MTTGQRVCAVVVTYNRKELLVGCLDALLGQSEAIARIIVVDNASTDGTAEFLKAHGYLAHIAVEHLPLPANRGGAGGFHEGFKRALTLDADWIWAMDDDGLPARNCLHRLLNAAPAGEFRGPMVLSRERMDDPENDELAFPGVIATPSGTTLVRSRSDVEHLARHGVLPGYASVFNGVLIHRRLVEEIGVPDDRFFIWGDEWDYIFRARNAGSPPATVASAWYWHPRDRTERAKIRFAGVECDVPRADSAFRDYLLIRNHGYLAYRYRGVAAWLRHTLKYVIYHRGHDGHFSPADVVRISIEGLRGRFHGRGSYDDAQLG